MIYIIFKDPVMSNSHSHLAMVLREEAFDMSCASSNVIISESDEGCEMEKKCL